MESVLLRLIDKIVKIVDPDKIILFGSRGKGIETIDSDYDLLVLKHGIKSRRAVAHEIYRNLTDIPAAVDILVETPERLEKHIHTPGFVYADAAKGQVIYER
ncbi:nucleotidyltransferase domain-containing protein [Paradesulfitobacterium aromaticivorans]